MPLHENHVWIAEAFFTPTEVDSILALANKKDWDEGRIGVVVTFLAILELLKDSLIEIVQSEEFGPIHIKGIEEVH